MTEFRSEAYPAVPRSVPRLIFVPEPDRLEAAAAEGEVTLVTNEGSALTPALCAALQASGNRVVVLTLPEALVRSNAHALPQGVQEVLLPDAGEAALEQALKGIFGQVSRLLFLYPHIRFPLGKLTLHFDKEKALLKTAFLLAKHLKASLTAVPEGRRPAFLTVTRLDGALGMKNPGNVSPVGGALPGLAKSLNIEWSKVFCRSVDLAPELPAPLAADLICRELYDADRLLVETAYDAEARRATVATETIPATPGDKLQSKVNSGSVFLVTGGARGITASCVLQLAAVFRSAFILAGRSELKDSDPSWALGAEDAAELKRRAMEFLKAAGEKPLPKAVQRLADEVLAQREIRDNLSRIRALGAKAHYVAVDVTDAAALRSAIDRVTPATGLVTAIIHGAGRLADKWIEHKTEADFDSVYDVKIAGLTAALQAVDPAPLRQIVLFSSVAGFYGNAGQTDYAMANEVLNRMAHLFRKNHPDVQVVSVDWGAWDGGMVSPELKKIFAEHQVALVPTGEGPLALADQLSTRYEDQAQVILGATLPQAKAATDGPLCTWIMERRLTEEANPFLRDHVIQGHAVLPVVHAGAWMALAATALYPGFYLHQVKDIQLFKGIVFDGNQSEYYQVKVVEQEKRPDSLLVEVSVSSRGSGKLPVPHYRSQVLLTDRAPEAPEEPLPHTGLQAPVMEDASGVYRDGTLFHGPDFQGVKKVLELDDKGLLLLCEHPPIDARQQGQFPVRPVNAFMADISYQGLLIWVRRFYGCASLPLRTALWEHFESIPFGKPFYVSMKVLRSDDFSMEADITAFDAQTGKIYMRDRGAGVAISRELQWV